MNKVTDKMENVPHPSYTEEWRDQAYFRRFDCKHKNIEELPGRRHRSCVDCGFDFDGSVGEASAESQLASADSAVVTGSLKSIRKETYRARLAEVASIEARDKEEINRQLALRTKVSESGISPVTVIDGPPLRDFQITVSVNTEIFAAIDHCNSVEELGAMIVHAMQARKQIKGYLLRAYARVVTLMKETGKYSKAGLDKFCREKFGRSRVYFENELSGRAQRQRDQRKLLRAAARQAPKLRTKLQVENAVPSKSTTLATVEIVSQSTATQLICDASGSPTCSPTNERKSRAELVGEGVDYILQLFGGLEPAVHNLAIFEICDALRNRQR